MITGIPKKYHIIADAAYIPLVWMAPKLLHFEDEQTVATICKISAAADYTYTLFTDAPWGYHKIIPYKVHALIDVAHGAAALTTAVVLPIKNKRARNTLLAMGIVGLAVGALSWIGSKHGN